MVMKHRLRDPGRVTTTVRKIASVPANYTKMRVAILRRTYQRVPVPVRQRRQSKVAKKPEQVSPILPLNRACGSGIQTSAAASAELGSPTQLASAGNSPNATRNVVVLMSPDCRP